MMFTLAAKRAALLALVIMPMFAGNDRNYTYLALGDSIAFGYDPTLVKPDNPLPKPDKFTGYPGQPGEERDQCRVPRRTGKSFLFGGLDDNGCEGFRDSTSHDTWTGFNCGDGRERGSRGTSAGTT